MERLSILVDDDVVQPEDLPQKILEQVGDPAELPDIEEPQLAESARQSRVFAATAPAAPVAAGSNAFCWPGLAVLEAQGMNLKDFLDAVESRLIDEALDKAEGVKNQAAEFLGIKRTTLIEKLKKRNP